MSKPKYGCKIAEQAWKSFELISVFAYKSIFWKLSRCRSAATFLTLAISVTCPEGKFAKSRVRGLEEENLGETCLFFPLAKVA